MKLAINPSRKDIFYPLLKKFPWRKINKKIYETMKLAAPYLTDLIVKLAPENRSQNGH